MSGKRSLINPIRLRKDFRSHLLILSASVLLLGITACGQVSATSTATAVPTPTPLPTATPAPTLQPGDFQRTLMVNGLERTYLLHIPAGLDSSRPLPLVFALHGYDNEIHFEISDLVNMTGFNDIADGSRFVVVYPSGVSGVWNAGTCCGTASKNNIDEKSFFRQILADLGKSFNIDAKRIYATGFSMGGMMAFRLACEMSDTFAAVAPVAGALVDTPCQPDQPVSLMQVHGKNDNAVPYNGGLGGFMTGTYKFPPVETSLATWAQLDGCSATATTEKQGIASHTVYPGCKGGSSVELYTIDALGNNWPSQYVLPVSQMIWDFFKAHPKP